MSVTTATMFPIRRLFASGGKAAAMSKTTFVRCFAASPLAGRKSLYDVLGVAPDSDQTDIKKAFITQSKKMHPDMVRHFTAIFPRHVFRLIPFKLMIFV